MALRSIPLAVASLVACDNATTSATTTVTAPVRSPTPAAKPPDPVASLLGWWKSANVCLELFANGDFELSDIRRTPKVLMMGKAKILADGTSFKLQLATERIWKGRFVSRCRKHAETGDFIDHHDVLGATLAPTTVTELVLRRTSDTEVELCATQCAKLARTTPHLGARWRRAELALPSSADASWQAGELLELDLGRAGGHVWAGLPDRKFARIYGTVRAAYVAPDRFTVTIVPERYTDAGAGTPAALGVPLAIGATHTLQVTRLAGERLEVCAAPERCTTLERQFNASSYELD